MEVTLSQALKGVWPLDTPVDPCVLAQLLVLMGFVSFVISPGFDYFFGFVNKVRCSGVLPGSVAQR